MWKEQQNRFYWLTGGMGHDQQLFPSWKPRLRKPSIFAGAPVNRGLRIVSLFFEDGFFFARGVWRINLSNESVLKNTELTMARTLNPGTQTSTSSWERLPKSLLFGKHCAQVVNRKLFPQLGVDSKMEKCSFCKLGCIKEYFLIKVPHVGKCSVTQIFQKQWLTDYGN